MALVMRRTSPTKVRVITTLIALFALVAQPMYGLVASYVANAATAGQVWITKALPNPVGNDKNGEYVVFTNQTNATVSLENWKFDDGNTVAATLHGVMSAGGSFKLCVDSVNITGCDQQWTSMLLGNSGDTLTLKDDNGTQIDRVSYTADPNVEGQEVSFNAHTPAPAPKYTYDFSVDGDHTFVVGKAKEFSVTTTTTDPSGDSKPLVRASVSDGVASGAYEYKAPDGNFYPLDSNNSFGPSAGFEYVNGASTPIRATYQTPGSYSAHIEFREVGSNNVIAQHDVPFTVSVASPTVTPCVTTASVVTTNLSSWYLGESRTKGHNVLVADGLHIYTDDSSSEAKAAGYYTTHFALKDLGDQTISEALDYDAKTGIAPGLQLAVDFNNDGTFDGYLVGEATYGNTWWLSNSAAQFVKDGAPHTGGGYGSSWYGTPNDWLSKFPNASVQAIGYSMGSGVFADGVIKKISLGCTNYTFTVPPADITAPTVPVNGAPNGKFLPTNEFDFTWDASTDASSPVTYEFQSSLNSAQTNGVLTTGVWSSGTLSEPKIHSSGAPDGTWYWQVRAIDAAGNKSNWSQVWKVTLDTQKPVVAISSPTNNQPLNVRSSAGKLSISGTASDSSNFNYYYCYVTITGHGEVGKRDAKCDTAWALGTPSKTAFAATAQGTMDGVLGSVDLTGASNGNYTVHLVAYDKAGNKSETSMPFVLDNTRPTVQVSPLASAYNPATYSVTATETDTTLSQVTAHLYNEANTTLVKSCSVNVRAQDLKTYTLHCDTTGVADGTYTIRANASDAAGNLSVTDSSVKFTLDRKAPTATVTYSNNNGAAVTADDVTVTLKASETIQAPAGWTKVDDVTFTKVYSENGKHSVTITDLAGNASTIAYEVKRIDKTAPEISLAGPQTNGIYTGDVNYAVKEQSIRNIIIDGKTFNEKNAPKTVSGDGEHTIVVVDKAGNDAKAAFTIDSTAPVLTLGAPSMNNDGTYSVAGSTTDPAAPITLTANDQQVKPVIVSDTRNSDGIWYWSANLGTLTADTVYTLVARSADSAGNAATAAKVAYSVPPVQGEQLVRIASLTPLLSNRNFGTPVNDLASAFATHNTVAAAQTTADDPAVLGTKTAKSADPAVADASDVAAIAPSAQGWKIFGLAWYWVLLILAAVIAAIWWIIAAARRRADA